MLGNRFTIITSIALLGLALVASATAGRKPMDKAPAVAKAMAGKQGRPLKIYILAGQSNMQGTGQLSTIPRMALSTETKTLHDRIIDEEGEPREHKNVSIVYFTGGDEKRGVKRELRVKKGLLKAGVTGALGPELAFGITMGTQSDDSILIIKTAWGGKSLNYNFRPPSAGIRPFEAPKPGRRSKPLPEEELKKKKTAFESGQGAYYRLMMNLIKGVLKDPGKYCAAYNPKQGYEIAGFGWFQGYNDQFYYPGSYDHYTKNMAYFIRDVRKELKTPNMPFVIGVMGVGGKVENPKALELRKCMAAPADMPEFKGNVMAVDTAQFWDYEMLTAMKKTAAAKDLWKLSEHWLPVGQPAEKDRIWNYTSFDLDEEKHYRDLKKGEKGDSRTLTGETPDELKGWLKSDFDTSKWQKGPAPIGKGLWGEMAAYWDEAKRQEVKDKRKKQKEMIRSPWGDGNMLLAKTTFDLKRTDICHFRVCIRSTRSFHVYLNGQRIKEYPFHKGYDIRKFDFDAKYVKQGKNEIAFYGNVLPYRGNMFNIVNVYLEGLPKVKADEVMSQQAAAATPRDYALTKGKSNAEFHYLGSAYIYCQIGEALAKCVIEMQKNAK